MEQLTSLPRLGDPGNMEPWALPAWQSWTPGPGGDAGGASPSMVGAPTDLRVGELRPEESSEPEGARSPGPVGGIEPGRTATGLPSPAQGALSSRPGCQRLEDPEAEAFSKVRELEQPGSATLGLSSCLPAWAWSGTSLPPVSSGPISVWGSVSVTVCPPFFGQKSQWFCFSPSVCPSD